MPISLNILMIGVLIMAAGLGGYLMAKIKFNAVMEARADAYRAQISRLKRAETAALADQDRLVGDLERSQRRVRRYEAAIRGPVETEEPVYDQTAHYDTPDLHPEPEEVSPQLDGEVLHDVKKAVDVDRFRIHFVRREIA